MMDYRAYITSRQTQKLSVVPPGWFVAMLPALVLAAIVLAVAQTVTAQTTGEITTYRFDNQRDGQNTSETILTRSNVNPSQFEKLFSDSVDGAVYAEPLYVPGVTVGNAAHNVVYMATENDSVYAFDADMAGPPLWHSSFIDPVNGVTTVASSQVAAKSTTPGCLDIFPQYGITGTPVIDLDTGTLYVVANTLEGGVNTYRLHALDIANGSEKFGGPVEIDVSVPGSGDDNDGKGHVLFDPTQEIQRAGLLLVNGVVYVAFGSHCDLAPWHGWLIGYSASSLSRLYVYNATANASAGGIWQSGCGPSSDESGDIYVGTGNGTFDANTGGVDFGDSMLRFGIRSSLFSLIDYFTPFNEASLQSVDHDLGSAGMVILPDQQSGSTHLLINAGKEGRIYLVDRDSMGNFDPNTDHVVQEVVSQLKLNWSTPAFWNGHVYFIASMDVPKAFSLVNGKLSSNPISRGSHTFPRLGGQPVVSANGTSDGILWTLEHQGSTITTGAGVLHAYDALDLTKELYNSDQYGTQDVPGLSVKFTVPTIINGKVYIGTQQELDVYGSVPGTPRPTPTPTTTPTPTPTPTPAALASVSPTSLSFGHVATGNTSLAKKVTLTNQGSVSLLFMTPAISGANAVDFAIVSSTCQSGLAPSLKCAMNLTFHPTATAGTTEHAALVIQDNATNSPQSVSLAGTSSNPTTVTPTTLNFGTIAHGTTSTKTVKLTNNQNGAISVSLSISRPPFTIKSTTCGGSLGASKSCNIAITFSPSTAGSFSGKQTITDSPDSLSPHFVGLMGSGS
jgi:hypothetical protein